MAIATFRSHSTYRKVALRAKLQLIEKLGATARSSRVVTYASNALQRLTAIAESPGVTSAYAYDDAGNRTGVWVNGTRTLTQTFNAANQVNGLTYDAAGNLTNDGTATYGYDALNRMEPRGQASGKVTLACEKVDPTFPEAWR